jgi:tetratricopeptide (TPR) repeat protein/DNA-binding CsgD family transcriptional regulator
MTWKTKILCIFLIVGLSLSIVSQESIPIDSLKLKLNISTDVQDRIDLLNKIAAELLYINSDEIYDYAIEALDISRTKKYKKGIAEAYNNLGIYYRAKGIYSEAIDYFFMSLDIMEEENDKAGIARSYNLIGILYFYLGEYNLSLEYYTKALELNIQQNDTVWIAGNSNNIGMIYEKLGQYNKAIEYYFKSLSMNQELNNLNWIANNYGNIASAYQLQNNEQSIEYYFKRLNIIEKQGNIDGIASTSQSIGSYYNSKENYQNALPYLLKSYTLADSIGILPTMSSASLELSKCYAGLNDFEKAFYYRTNYKILNDSLNLDRNTQKIIRMEMQYNHQKELRLKELKYQRAELIYTSVAISLVAILIIIIMTFRRQRAKGLNFQLEQKKLQLEKIGLQEELSFKSNELQTNIKYLVDKNDIITSVLERLSASKPLFKTENQQKVNDIIFQLQQSMSGDVWQDFEYRFKDVHGSFYDNLLTQYPDLTANEQKLCAFLKLEMSTKEIALLNHQSIKSVETARSRLRKKLNISNKDIKLVDFLSNF